ncbi:MAG: hypothetical protein CM15mP101_09150 [Flavobacteriaceae bacterium]|nr:MAG: hypothetical protein CM15mP101_09150 [Flavobacteriaceae bacterium]
MNNSEIRNVTKEILKGKYKNVMLPFLLATLLLSLTQQQELYSSAYEAYGLSYVFTIGSLALFIQGPISIGLATYSLSIANEKEYNYNQIISAFKHFFKALILVLLFTISSAIGFLLLIVPGIFIALMFSQIFYIMAEDPSTGVIDAFKKSASLMKNKKLQYLGLILRYILFFILGVFTLGIWWLWLIPQAYVSFAIFYKELQS